MNDPQQFPWDDGMQQDKLKTGTMVKLIQRRPDGAIRARSKPEPIMTLSNTSSQVLFSIPEGDVALYMSSVEDKLDKALSNQGPYGMHRMALTFHLVLWEGQPVWLSSADVVLVKVAT